MNTNEIERYLATSSTKSVCVARKLSERYHGFVIDITIVEKSKVCIEYNTFGYDEGGLAIILTYRSQEELIKSLEEFIGAPIDKWMNVNRSGFYPDAPNNMDFESSGKLLKKDLFNRCIDIPQGWSGIEVLGNYWLDIYNGKPT